MSHLCYVVSRAFIFLIAILFCVGFAHSNPSVEGDHSDVVAISNAENAAITEEVGQLYSDSKYNPQSPLHDDREANNMLEASALSVPEFVNCSGMYVHYFDIFAADPSVVNGIDRQWTQQQLQDSLDNARDCWVHPNTSTCCFNPPCKCKLTVSIKINGSFFSASRS